MYFGLVPIQNKEVEQYMDMGCRSCIVVVYVLC
jgi:hypothetical protein